MLRIIFEEHPNSHRWDKSPGRKVRTIDIREYSGRWESGDYAAKFYVDPAVPLLDAKYELGYVMNLPYKTYKKEHLVYLVLKKYLEKRGYEL